MSSTSAKPGTKQYVTPEERKEEYRRYLERTHVVEAVTSVLVKLYEEEQKPPKPLEFIRKYFGAPTNVDVQALQEENQELKDENQELKKIITELSKRNQELKDQLDELEG